MAELTITYNVRQRRGAEFAHAQHVAGLPPVQIGVDPETGEPVMGPNPNPPALEDYVRARFADVLDSWADARAAAREYEAGIREKYLGLSDADQAEVDALINAKAGQ